MLKEYYNLDYETKGRAAHNGLYARSRRSAIEIIELIKKDIPFKR
jgi:hypothetical protein